MTGAGLQCHVSDDGRVEVAIAGQSLQLSESQLARSPVLNSIADKPGVGIIPFSEEAFQHWYAHVEPVSRKSAADAKALLQASIFLQDAQVATFASQSIAHKIRKAIRPAFVDCSDTEGMQFPKQAAFILPIQESLSDLAAQLADVQIIEAAEIASHLSAAELLVFAKNSKNLEFQSCCELKSMMNVTRELQFATPKFVHAFFEACTSPMAECGGAALRELHLPSRCFTDSNIDPMEPIQKHVSSLHTLSVIPSVFVKHAQRDLKEPFASFLSTVACMSNLKELRFGIPNLPTKTARATNSSRIKKMVRSLHSLTSLTALQLAAPLTALDTPPIYPSLLSHFPALVHLHLQPSGIGGKQAASNLQSSLRKLPATMQSIHLNILDTSYLSSDGTMEHWKALSQLLQSLAHPEPLYPHLTYLVFQGAFSFGLHRDDWCLKTIDASWRPDGSVQADVALSLNNCDAVRSAGLSEPLHVTLPTTHTETSSQGTQNLDLKLRVRSLQLNRNVGVDVDGIWDDYLDPDEEQEQGRWGGYLEQLLLAAVREEQSYSTPGRSSGASGGGVGQAQAHVHLVGEHALTELKVMKTFKDHMGQQDLLPNGRHRGRIAEQRRKRAEFFKQYVELRTTRLARLQYNMDHHVNEHLKSQPALARIQHCNEAEDIEAMAQYWKRQTCATRSAAADSDMEETGPGALRHLSIDMDGFSDTLPHDLQVLHILCGGQFTGLQHLNIYSLQPVSWAPDAVHRSLTPALHNLSVLTTLNSLAIQRVPGVCVLIEALSSSLTALELLSLHGVEHDGDAVLELGSYLGLFTALQRLELDFLPLFGARTAIGAGRRCMMLNSAYGGYRRRGHGSHMDDESDESSECYDENAGVVGRVVDEAAEAREIAEMCGCDVEDLLESEEEDGVDDNTHGGDPHAGSMRLRKRFCKRFWNGISALPLLDGVEVRVASVGLGDEFCVDPAIVRKE